MKNNSIWLQGFKENLTKPNTVPSKVDVCIIGGGIAGMSTAFQLRNSNLNILLIDKGTIGFGVTAYTTAKISCLQELPLTKITSMHNEADAKLYFCSQKEAFDTIANAIKEYEINCDYEIVNEYILGNSKNEIKKIKKEESYYQKWNIPYIPVNQLPIPISFSYGIGMKGAVFHPLKYLYGLKKIIENKITILENVTATNIEKKEKNYIITTDVGTIETSHVVVTTHYPFFIKPGWIPFKTHVEKSYVIASNTKEPKALACIKTGSPFHSIRYHKDFIIYGSYAHALTNHLDDIENFNQFETRFKRHFQKEIQFKWFNQDLIPNDGLPLIGKLEDKIYLATGFHTWGMTNGTIAGTIIADLIVKGKSEYEALFSIKRNWNFNRIGHFFVDGFRYGKIYLQTILIKNPNFYKNHVCVTYENGKRIGIYLDENGVKHKVLNTCPHMKCKLIFNEVEKTWDCPCHSSRFDIDGHVIKGPSKDSIQIQKS